MTSLGEAMLPSAGKVDYDLSRRWSVLCPFLISTAQNAFMFMSYSVTPSISKSVLSPTKPLSDGELDWTYSVSLTAVVIFMLPASALLRRHNYATMLVAVPALLQTVPYTVHDHWCR